MVRENVPKLQRVSEILSRQVQPGGRTESQRRELWFRGHWGALGLPRTTSGGLRSQPARPLPPAQRPSGSSWPRVHAPGCPGCLPASSRQRALSWRSEGLGFRQYVSGLCSSRLGSSRRDWTGAKVRARALLLVGNFAPNIYADVGVPSIPVGSVCKVCGVFNNLTHGKKNKESF